MKLVLGENDFASQKPLLVAEWDNEKNGDLTPKMVTVMSHKHVWWKCSAGHSWKAQICGRSIGNGCPYCANQKVWPGFNDLASQNPPLAAEWDDEKNDDLTPQMVTEMSHTKVWWKCEKGHSWNARIEDRSKGTGCPFCAGKKTLPGFNDLATYNPLLAAEWDNEKNGDLTPKMVTAMSHKVVWWKCSEGHSWYARVESRSLGESCPYCANQKVWPGFNDLATQNPLLAAEWDDKKNGDLTPQMITTMSNKKVWWKCAEGHSWSASINARSYGNGCPYCANKKVRPGFNDLATQNPLLATEWDDKKNGDLTPQMITAMSNKKVWWKCSEGHSWSASIDARSRGNGCPYCANKKAWPGFNDLASQNPLLATEWDYEKNNDLTPQMVTTMSNKRVWWKCSEGHSWKSTIADRSRRNNRCPRCNKMAIRRKYRG